ncbi:peptidoglycan-binding protein [Candidatus Nomurabacteria bacterium]|nr:peptidoglycan-binding protein [Candidatus Nomurabacteria bacterium]
MNLRKIITTIITLVLITCSYTILSPVTNANSEAVSIDQIEGLLEQITKLQTLLVQIQQTNDVICTQLSNSLYLGSTDKNTSGEVSKLQQYLSQTGHYKYGEITGYYGPVTQEAVRAWQSEKGIISYGNPETTGFGLIGPATRKSISMNCITSSPTKTSDKIGKDIVETRPPSIDITYPNGGEQVTVNDGKDVGFRIKWNSNDLDGIVNVYLLNQINERVCSLGDVPVDKGEFIVKHELDACPDISYLPPSNIYRAYVEVATKGLLKGKIVDTSDDYFTVTNHGGVNKRKTIIEKPWGNLRKVSIEGFNGNAQEPFISRDDKYLFFNDFQPDSKNRQKKMHWATRVDDTTFKYQGYLEGVNGSGSVDGAPSMDQNGNFYWISTRSYLDDLITVYKGKFTGNSVEKVVKLTGNYQVEKWNEINFDVEVSKDGNKLYVVESLMESGNPREADFILINNQGKKLRQNIISSLNSDVLEYAASISSDELEIYFTRVSEVDKDADFGIYVATRNSKDEPFGNPERVTAVGTGLLEAPSINNAGNLIYFHKLVDNKFYIYVIER